MLKFFLFSSSSKTNFTFIRRLFNSSKAFNYSHNEKHSLHAKINESLSRNMLIYSKSSNDGMLKSFYGLGFFAVMSLWGLSNLQLTDTVKIKRASNDNNNDSTIRSFQEFVTSNAFINVTSVLLIFIGASVAGFFLFSNLREVNKLYLLKGSNKIGIVADGIFARQQTFKVNLADVSFKTLRKDDSKMLKFKVKDKSGYFNMNLVEGSIDEKELFDYIVCSQRF
jgi:hypothetical protein